MNLSREDVLELLETGRDPELLDAEYQEKRLQMHSKFTVRLPVNNQAFNDFLSNYPESLLPAEKYKKFCNLITAPLPTVDEVQTAYNELTKVFQAQNRVEDFFFEDDTLQDDWLRYREFQGEPNWWRKQGWDILQNKPNTVIVIDLPQEQGGKLPEPFFFPISIEQITHLESSRDGVCEYLVYKIWRNDADKDDPIEQHIVLDDLYYRVYERDPDHDPEFILVLEALHGLGYCPAKQFWAKPIPGSKVMKSNPISSSLGNLDWLLYSIVSKRHLDLYAGFPITSLYEQECTYQTPEGYSCENGWVNREVETRTTDSGIRIQRDRCPQCGGGQFAGPGSVITVPAPRDSEDSDNMPGVQITQGDVPSLVAMREDVDRQLKNFMETTVGFGGEASNEQAKNQKQIQSNFETRESILQEIANNFSVIQKFTLDTMARLRYGEAYHGSILNYGTKFFLMSIDDMLLTYKSSKDTGMPSSDLNQQRSAIYAKKFANDPMQLTRINMLTELEPLESYTISELMQLNLFIDPKDMALKVNFDDVIQRFEGEYGKIQMFLPGVPMSVRLAKIEQVLRSYVSTKELQLKEPEVQPKQIANG